MIGRHGSARALFAICVAGASVACDPDGPGDLDGSVACAEGTDASSMEPIDAAEADASTISDAGTLDAAGHADAATIDAGPTSRHCLALPAPVVTSHEVEIPIDADTLRIGDGIDGLELSFPDLYLYTELSPHDDLGWSNPPPADGSSCDAGCLDAVLARAAERGGTLPATVTSTLVVQRRCFGPVDEPTCSLAVGEEVEVDLRDAVRGIDEDLEVYDFLVFESWNVVTVGALD